MKDNRTFTAHANVLVNETSDLLADRQRTHGDFSRVACTSQRLKDDITDGTRYSYDLPYIQREALQNICQKMSRIVNGNSNEPDHWQDIIGYATLALNSLEPSA